ncbi:hypothetical protein D9M71_257790 [compost metagenome]
MDFRQVHDFHFAVVVDEAAFFTLARETDAPGNVLVQVAKHDQGFDQKDRLACLVLHQAQVVANPAGWAVVPFGCAIFVVEFVEVKLAGVVHQFRNIQGDVRAAAAQADQADGRELLVAAQFAAVIQVRGVGENHVAQTVEVVEDALDIGLGEVEVLLGIAWARAIEPLRTYGLLYGRG